MKNYVNLLADSGVEITSSRKTWRSLGEKYGIATEEVGLIDFNRTGVVLPNEEVKIGFRTRFNGSLLYENDWSWYALPVRSPDDSNFRLQDGRLFFLEEPVGATDTPVLDTCNTSYQRGPRLLNLNSRSRSECFGCRACVHNDKQLYDDTVIKDKSGIKTEDELRDFLETFEQTKTRIANLEQIAVVTGLFRSEVDTLEHLQMIYKVASEMGFSGELMYFGCQLISRAALSEFAACGKTAIVFAVDNFTYRKERLSPIKSGLTLAELKKAMHIAASYGIDTTFAYIVGVDPLDDLAEGFKFFAPVTTRFPIINIFQGQSCLQMQALCEEARTLEYYLKARRLIEHYYLESGLRPRRWENYRPLWYRTFFEEDLVVKPYG